MYNLQASTPIVIFFFSNLHTPCVFVYKPALLSASNIKTLVCTEYSAELQPEKPQRAFNLQFPNCNRRIILSY